MYDMVVYRERLRETCAYATVAAMFLGSLVSTAVTDQPDQRGAVIHGTLVWVLFSFFSVWMIAGGISLGLNGLYGAVSGLARGATTAVAAGRRRSGADASAP